MIVFVASEFWKFFAKCIIYSLRITIHFFIVIHCPRKLIWILFIVSIPLEFFGILLDFTFGFFIIVYNRAIPDFCPTLYKRNEGNIISPLSLLSTKNIGTNNRKAHILILFSSVYFFMYIKVLHLLNISFLLSIFLGQSAKCSHNVCANAGKCVQQWTSYTCDCDMTSFTGPTCSDGKKNYFSLKLLPNN